MKKKAECIILENVFYTIAARNGKVLEVANYNTENGAAVQLWDYAGAPWQQWSFVACGPVAYRIKNRFTGKCIDLALRGKASGTLLHQWTETTNPSQSWTLQPSGGGTRIASIHANKFIDLSQMCTANGARAQIWDFVEGGNQEWHIKRVQERSEKGTFAAPPNAQTGSETIKPGQRKHANDLVAKLNGGDKTSRRKSK